MMPLAENSINENEKFKVIARYMEGVKVIGYHLIDQNGNGHKIDKNTVEELALSKAIINCTAQRYKGEIVIKGVNCKLSDLPVIDASNGKLRGEDNNKKKASNANQFTIIGRITNGKVTIGYVMHDGSGANKKVRRDLVLQLARDGKVSNARAQLYGDRLLLRGVGVELSQLPILKSV